MKHTFRLGFIIGTFLRALFSDKPDFGGEAFSWSLSNTGFTVELTPRISYLRHVIPLLMYVLIPHE